LPVADRRQAAEYDLEAAGRQARPRPAWLRSVAYPVPREACVRRFISHEELARDSRFRRQQSRNRLIASLPEDVDGIVRVLEEVGPKIRKRLEGSPFEAVYDDVGELQALEAAGRTLWDFPDAPWEFKMNMARQCWDEARHIQVYEKLIEHVGGEVGEFPENTFLFETSCNDDPALRVTGVNRCLEGLACSRTS
jgi:hypothetical protein